MFCPKCGNENDDNSKYCSCCGTDISGWNMNKFSNERSNILKSWGIWKRPGDIVELLGCIIVIISLFISYISVTILGSKMGFMLISGDGKLILILAIIAIVGVFLQGNKVIDMLGAIEALITVAFSVVEIILIENRISEYEYSTFVYREAGYYFLILGALTILVGLIIRAIVDDMNRKRNSNNSPSGSRRRSWEDIKAKLKRRIPFIVSGTIVAFIVLIGLILYFSLYHLNSEERKLVVSTIEAIDELDSIDLDSEYEIGRAERLYASLSPKCLRYVKNGERIQEARQTYNELCTEHVIEEISSIGEVTLDKQEEIQNVLNDYYSLSEDQSELVSNKDVLFEAVKQLSAMQEAESVVQLYAEGVVNLNFNQINQTLSDELITNDSGSLASELSLYLSEYSEGVTEALFGGRIKYEDLGYYGKQTIDDLSEALVDAVWFKGYEVENVRYNEGIVIADIKFYSPNQENLNPSAIICMNDDMKEFVDLNRSWLSYYLYGKSEKEQFVYIFERTSMIYGDIWVSELRNAANGLEMEYNTITIQVEKINDDWKITKESYK